MVCPSATALQPLPAWLAPLPLHLTALDLPLSHSALTTSLKDLPSTS